MGVVKTEQAVIVFDIVFVEEVVDLGTFFRVFYVNVGPFKSFGHVIAFLSELRCWFIGN